MLCLILAGIGSVALAQETTRDIQLNDLGVQPQYQSDPLNDNSPTPPQRETWIEQQRREQDHRDHNNVQPYGRIETDPRTGEVESAEGGAVTPY